MEANNLAHRLVFLIQIPISLNHGYALLTLSQGYGIGLFNILGY